MKNITRALLISSLILSMGILTACNKTQAKPSGSSSVKVSSSTTTSSAKTSTTSTEAEKNNKMDLSQIKTGDFSSLLGDWQIVAVSLNRQDGNGDSWIDPRGDQLTVTETQLTSGNMTLSGNTLNDGEDKAVTYSEKDGYLQADTTAGAIVWNLSFYPADVPMENWGELPPAIDQKKERVVIRTSNNNYVQVFQRKEAGAATTTSSSAEAAAPAVTMDPEKIRTGDYSSIAGTWKNGRGATIVVNGDTMEFSDISGLGWPAKLTGLTVDIPSQNSPEGTPKQVEYMGGTTIDAYKPEMKVSEYNGYTYFTSTIPGALISVAFLPSGMMGELQSGQVDQEKIIAIGTQNSATSVPEDVVYYKVQ